MKLALEKNRKNINLFLLYCFAFSCMLSVAGSTIFIWSLTFMIIIDKKKWNCFYKKPMFILFVLSNIYIILSGIYGYITNPLFKHIQLEETLDWIRLWLFLSVGLVVNGEEQTALNMLKFLFAGFLISIITYLIKYPSVLFVMPRVGFNHKILSMSLYSCVAILGMSLFSHRIYVWIKDKKNSFLYMILLFLIYIIIVDVLLITRSRTAWISILIVLPLILFVYYRRLLHYRRLKLKWIIAFFSIIFFLGVCNFNVIKTRLLQEYPTFKSIIKGKENSITLNSSTGARYYLFKFGIEKIKERPIFGWGAGTTTLLIRTSTNPPLKTRVGDDYKWFDHLHNNYLEILVRFGIIGSFLMLLTFLLLIKRLTKCYIIGSVSHDTYLFLIGSILLMFLCGLTNFRLLHPDHRFFWTSIGGIIYGLGLCSSENNCKKNNKTILKKF